MEKLDLKDRKILYQLDLNCRQSNSQIGKKVGLSKQVVDYRIKRMEDIDIIKRYWTNIDSYKLGYEVYRYYIVFQNVDSRIKSEIIEYFANYGNMWVVDSAKGIYDLVLVIWVKNILKFYKFWDNANEKYGDYFAEKIFSIYLQASVFPLTYLLLDKFDKTDRDKYEQKVGGETAKIDYMDYRILSELAENARISLVELAETLQSSSQNISYRVKNLIKKGVIQGFKLGIDTKKIGYEHFKVDIWLKEPSKRRKIWNYIKYNPYVTFINTSAGYADIEIEFNIEDLDKLLQTIENISSEFPGVIRKYTYFSGVASPYRIRCIPEISEEDFKTK